MANASRPASQRPGLTFLGKLVVFAFIAGCFYAAYSFFGRDLLAPLRDGGGSAEPAAGGEAPRSDARGGVEIGIAYGTEKQRWLEWAVERFAETSAGKRIRVQLIPLGSLEGAQALLAGDQRIHVWSPASTLYTETFVQEWQLQHGKSPVVRQEVLALSPMVFVFWQERYQAFRGRYGEVSFATVGQALGESGGWNTIASKPEWGLFKFGHTHPNQSNSGLMSLVLMAYEYHGKTAGLSLEDVLNVEFQQWFQGLEGGVSGMVNSTGNMMRDMVLRGPSSYDALFVYENVAIDYLENAAGRWGELRIAYPQRNMWNDNPYYVIDAPWSSREQRRAAEELLDFLLRDEVQKQALVHGFRPGNPSVPINLPDSPFVRYQRYGLQVDLASVCAPPPPEVIHNLLAGWQRSRGAR